MTLGTFARPLTYPKHHSRSRHQETMRASALTDACQPSTDGLNLRLPNFQQPLTEDSLHLEAHDFVGRKQGLLRNRQLLGLSAQRQLEIESKGRIKVPMLGVREPSQDPVVTEPEGPLPRSGLGSYDKQST